jgi:hypothetical protein
MKGIYSDDIICVCMDAIGYPCMGYRIWERGEQRKNWGGGVSVMPPNRSKNEKSVLHFMHESDLCMNRRGPSKYTYIFLWCIKDMYLLI